jgi:hypothetical protein
MTYDANNNVRERKSTYKLLNDNGTVSGTTSSEDYWYKYDSMNRYTVTKGIQSGSNIVRSTTGATITYDAAGERITVATDEFGTTTTETDTYAYAADGTLESATIVSSAGTQTATYTMDTMGRVTNYTEAKLNSDGSSTQVYNRVAHYDADSLVTDDTVTTLRSDNHTVTWATTYDYKADSNYDGDYTDATDLFQGGAVTHNTAAETGSQTANTSSAYSYISFNGGPVESSEVYKPDGTHRSSWTAKPKIELNVSPTRAMLLAERPLSAARSRINTFISERPISTNSSLPSRSFPSMTADRSWMALDLASDRRSAG